MVNRTSHQISITDLVKRYPGGVTAVDHVSLNIEPGEVLALLGPSGCGKTTLLQSIAGFVVPDEGDIRLDDNSIIATPPERRRTAMMFQHYALFPHMSVRDNVGYGLRMTGVAKPEIRRRVDEAMAMVKIESFADRRPSQLSGGQRQRVALSRAVVTEPRVLLLDEPLGALDQNLREEMQVELRKLQQQLGLTTVMVTHDQHEAIVLADRIAVMRDGHIEQVATARELYDRPATRFVAEFMGVENFPPCTDLGEAVEVFGRRLAAVQRPSQSGSGSLLALRGEFIQLDATSGQNDGMTGQVAFAQMLGARMRYEVMLSDGTKLVVVQSRLNKAPFAIGEAVDIHFDPSACVLLEE